MKLLKLKSWLRFGNSKKLYIAGDYFSDGKFLVHKKYFEECNMNKTELKQNLKLNNDVEEIPDWQRFITEEKNLRSLLVTNECVSCYNDFNGYSRYLINGDEKLKILVYDDYIMGLAEVFKSNYSISLIYKGIEKEKPVHVYYAKNNELVAVLMPVRFI